MPALTPDDRAKLLAVDTANAANRAAAKLQAGKPLTKRERALIAGEQQPDTYVATWDDLAAQLSIDERSLFNFRKRHAREIVERKALLERADGRHCVPEWRKFAAEFDELKGRGANNPDIDHIDERDLRLRERRFAVELGEHKLMVQKGQVLALIEYQAALRVTVGAFDAALKQIPGRAAEKLVQRARLAITAMLRAELTDKQFAKLAPLLETAPVDHAGIVEILDLELEAARRALAEADFLEPAGVE